MNIDDAEKLVKAGLNGWIDAYLNGKIDSETLAALTTLDSLHLETISEHCRTTLPIVICCLISKEPFTSQKRKEIKENLSKIKDAFNQAAGKNKAEAVEKLVEELLTFILAE